MTSQSRLNLLRWLNALAYILVGSAVVWMAVRVIRWGVLEAASPAADAAACKSAAGACWPFLASKVRLILFGRYPYEEQWRPALFLVVVIVMIAWTLWYTLKGGNSPRAGRTVLIAWTGLIVVGFLLMQGGVSGLARVTAESWDGLPLTLMLACFASFGAFWLAIPLALARRSEMPVLRLLATGYIEFVRGIPLVGFLFMAFVLTPMFLPPGWALNSPLKAGITLTLFLSAYTAEVVRGALQNVPQGQYDAAASIGLGYWKTLRSVVLPQALRQALPSLANIFIAAIKDTSVVFTVGMFDLMGAAENAVNDASWGGRFLEIYVFVGVIYVAMCGVVSLYSRALERRAAVA